MNISRNEQRALHVRALADFDLTAFNRLRQKRRIGSRSGSPYRISKRGLTSVCAYLDNQGV